MHFRLVVTCDRPFILYKVMCCVFDNVVVCLSWSTPSPSCVSSFTYSDPPISLHLLSSSPPADPRGSIHSLSLQKPHFTAVSRASSWRPCIVNNDAPRGSNTHTQAHGHTHAHTRMHTHTHTYTHAEKHTYT